MNEHKHVEVISTSAWDLPVEDLLTKMKSKLEELTKLADEITKKIEAEKQERVIPRQASERYGFLLPGHLAAGFNAASGAVEVKALPCDVYSISRPSELEDFRTVLRALADPATRENNRNAIFVPRKKRIQEVTAQYKAAIDIAEGKSATGFNVTVLTASNNSRQFCHLFIVEDKLRGQTVVAGPEKIERELAADLKKKGIVYVCRHDKRSVDDINEFLAEGAKWRGERGLLSDGNTQNMIEALVLSVSMYSSLGHSVAAGTTVGKVICDAPAPFCSIQVTKPQPAFRATPLSGGKS